MPHQTKTTGIWLFPHGALIALLAALLSLTLSGATAGPPSGELIYVGADLANGQTALYCIDDLGRTPRLIDTRPGTTAGLVICEGVAFWAVEHAGAAILYRENAADGSVRQLAARSAPGAKSAALETCGKTVYWVVRDNGGAVIYYADPLQNSATALFPIGNATPAALHVESGVAYWAMTIGGTLPTARVTRLSPSLPPTTIWQRANSTMAGLAIAGGRIWMASTEHQTTGPMAQLRDGPLAQFDNPSTRQVPGTARHLVANDHLAAWSVENASGQASVRVALVAGAHLVIHPPNFGGSAGIILGEDAGICWEDSEEGTLRVFDFADPLNGTTLQPGGRTLSVHSMGRDFWIHQEYDERQWFHLVELFGQASEADIWRSVGSFAPGIVGAGKWDGLVVSGASIQGAPKEYGPWGGPFPAAATSGIIATSDAVSPRLPHAANTSPDGRTLFVVDRDVATQVGMQWVDPAEAHFPQDFQRWNNEIWFSAEGWEGRRAMRLPAGEWWTQEEYPTVDPRAFGSFRGGLYWNALNENGERDLHARLASGQEGKIAAISEDSQGSLLFDYGGRAFFSAIREGVWHLGLTYGQTQDADFIEIPGATGDPQDFTGWRGWTYFHAALAEGGRGFFVVGPENEVRQLDAAENFHSVIAMPGGLYCVKVMPGVPDELVWLNDVDSNFREIFDTPDLIEHLTLHQGRLHGLGQQDGESAIFSLWTPSSLSQISTPQNTKRLFSFQGDLYAAAGGLEPHLFRSHASQWNIVDSVLIDNLDDFTEYAGRLYFSADKSPAERGLFSLQSRALTQRPSEGNPRAMRVHGGRLIFSSGSDNGHQLYAHQAALPLGPNLEFIGSPVYSNVAANPIIDGPRLARPMPDQFPENMPVGARVATLELTDAEDLSPLSLSWNQESHWLGLNGLDLVLAVPATSWNPGWIHGELRAANRLGIFNVIPVDLQVRDNYQAWLQEHFPDDSEDPLVSGDTVDPDGDRLVNLMERALGLDPRNSFNASGIPSGEIDSSSGRLNFSFSTPIGLHSGLHYRVMAGDDLVGWTMVAELRASPFGELIWDGPNVESVMTEVDNNAGLVRYTVGDLPISPQPKERFMRLEVLNWR